MDRGLSDEQGMLQETARRFLQEACTPSFLRGAYREPEQAHSALWPRMAEMGWTALGIDEAFGGVGADFATLAVLLEEMGRACLPGPFFASVVLGGLMISEFADDRQRNELLPALASGKSIVSLAIQEGASEFDLDAIATSARWNGEAYLLTGRKQMVLHAHLADTLLCVARIDAAKDATTSGLGLFLVPRSHPAVRCMPLTEIAGRCSDDVEFSEVALPASALLGGQAVALESLERLLLKSAVAKSAEMLGGARRAMEIAVEYAKERRQFGKPIGSFQAIQHHCANMLVLVETACRMVNETVGQVDQGEWAPARAAMTKVWCNRAYREVIRLAHQVMGGIGYIEEHAMPWHFRHARHNEGMLGDTDTLLDLVADALYAARDDAGRAG